ncbi:MAG: hypothetical protein K2L94_02995 [Alphaproteobacteria bacterium]|nr:hypothetical protein [Alphaproteobacteria bacterium]
MTSNHHDNINTAPPRQHDDQQAGRMENDTYGYSVVSGDKISLSRTLTSQQQQYNHQPSHDHQPTPTE